MRGGGPGRIGLRCRIPRLLRGDSAGETLKGRTAAGEGLPVARALDDLPDDVTLFGLGRLESEIAKIVGATVDVVPAGNLRANIRDKALAEAVPL